MTRRDVALAAWALLGCLVASSGCGPRQIAPPPPAPTIAHPTQAIPADLDLGLRLDLGRIKAVLGPAAFGALEKEAARSAEAAPGERRLITDALRKTDTIWIALRPARTSDLTDRVLVLEGRFEGFDPGKYELDPPWHQASDLGGGWRVHERAAPLLRSSPARVYLRHEDLVLMVSEAEIDSVARALDGHFDPAVTPPAEGVVSLHARAGALRALIEDRSPKLAELLARTEGLKAHADLPAGGLDAELDVTFQSPAEARRTQEAMGLLTRALTEQGGPAGLVAGQVQVQVVGRHLVARVDLPPDELASVVYGSAYGPPLP